MRSDAPTRKSLFARWVERSSLNSAATALLNYSADTDARLERYARIAGLSVPEALRKVRKYLGDQLAR
jgi:hypothetical protein